MFLCVHMCQTHVQIHRPTRTNVSAICICRVTHGAPLIFDENITKVEFPSEMSAIEQPFIKYVQEWSSLYADELILILLYMLTPPTTLVRERWTIKFCGGTIVMCISSRTEVR